MYDLVPSRPELSMQVERGIPPRLHVGRTTVGGNFHPLCCD